MKDSLTIVATWQQANPYNNALLKDPLTTGSGNKLVHAIA